MKDSEKLNLQRRRVLMGMGAAGVALAGSALSCPVMAAAPAQVTEAPSSDKTEDRHDFHGVHQTGIVTPRPASGMLVAFDVLASDREDLERLFRTLNERIAFLMKGGPVETGRGFVLHSSDFFIRNATLPIDDDICLTATLDILKAIAAGSGPKHAILALGYAGWAPGQLENEIQHNGWLHCPADPDLVFGRDAEDKYRRALEKIGIDLAQLSSAAGHA